MLLRRGVLRIRPLISLRWNSENAQPTTTGKSSQALRTHQSKDPEMLETVAFEDLPRAQQRFVKQFEKVNDERIKEIFVKNYKNHIAFGVLVATVVGIYWYTLHAVKQETFLEEIDEEMAREHPTTHGHLVEKKEIQ